MAKHANSNESADDFMYPQREIFNDFGSLIDNFFEPRWGMKFVPKCTTFKVDIKEKDKAYVVEAELPGVKKGDVDVKIDNQTLSISVKHDSHSDESGEGYIHRERCSSSMSRSIRLPNAKMDEVRAKLENGILMLTIPKRTADDNGSRKVIIE